MFQPLRPNNQHARTASGDSIPAPIEGWDAISPLAKMKPERAVVLDNWFPQPGYVEVRKGYKTHATGMGSGVVETLMAYQGLTNSASRLFAGANSRFYDVTAEATASATSVSGLTNNRWQYVNFTNASGTCYLWACNGADAPKTFDGSSWANPSISGITASDAINVTVHKNRIWMVLNGSMNAAYLNTDAIQGTATKFPLGSVMKKGGFLVSAQPMTHDAGDGPDDYLVFMSSRGQAAIYQGTDPTSSSTWGLVGVYDMGSPLGYRCLTKVAGDLAVVGIDGVLPFSIARSQDRGAAASVAITQRINNAMNSSARSYGSNFGWELVPYAKGTAAILNVPIQEGVLQYQYVMNTLTGAWCRYKGMNANCWVVYNDKPYFGANDGKVCEADTGSSDGTAPVDAIGQTAFNYFNRRGIIKQYHMIQPLITTDSQVNPAIGISTDFKDNATVGTPTTTTTVSALYDTALYDTDVYAIEARNISDWTSISGIGQCAAVHFRSKTGSDSGVAVTGNTIIRLNGFNLTYEPGEFL